MRKGNIVKIVLPVAASLLIMIRTWLVWISSGRGRIQVSYFFLYVFSSSIFAYANSLLLITCFYSIIKSLLIFLSGKRRNKKIWKKPMQGVLSTSDELGDGKLKYPFINFREITAATNNFSNSNMLGHGCFGNVYKVIISLSL